MKTTVGAYEAKTKLPELLRQVRNGKSFTITNRGEAIADLVPTKPKIDKGEKDPVADMLEFMKSRPIFGGDLKELIEEGRD